MVAGKTNGLHKMTYPSLGVHNFARSFRGNMFLHRETGSTYQS